MRRFGLVSLLVLAAGVYSVAPAAAGVTAGDAAATHAYLEARVALQRTLAARGPAAIVAIEALATKVAGECPGVLDGAPPLVKGERLSQAGDELTSELLTATLGAGGAIEHPAYTRFARTVRKLHWSNPRLTRLLRSLALEQAEQAAVRTPNLCADVKFWVTSGYTTVSPGTKSYLHRLSVVASTTVIKPEGHEPISDLFNLSALVAHRLKPYENRVDEVLARKALPPQAEITSPDVRAYLEAAGKVLVALGRTPTPAS